jgi:hypothetical protein
MKNRGIIALMLGFLLAPSFSCFSQEKETPTREVADNGKVILYYFHFERRCATCMAVESESEKALQELYPEKMKSGEITFLSVNLEDKSNDALAEMLKVEGQSLLMVRDGKQENLTNVAFMHARTNPDKLKDAIRESVGKL